MKNRLVVFVVVSALSLAVLGCAGGAKAKGSAFDGTWTEVSGITLTIAGAEATVKEGDIVLVKGSVAVTDNTAKATTSQIANAEGNLADEKVEVTLTLAGDKITAEFEGATYTFAK
ncbi:MAG: hypothetical protein LBS86_01195 [Treponema sp.]|jgi:hypothetical protein|nr:hypothetical protein [Treponema sp.]